MSDDTPQSGKTDKLMTELHDIAADPEQWGWAYETAENAIAEIERLTRINAELVTAHNSYVINNAKKAEEIERLREALKRVEDIGVGLEVTQVRALIKEYVRAVLNGGKV